MTLADYVASIIGKVCLLFIKNLKLGSGLTWPGEIVLRLRPDFLKVIRNNADKIIVISGTNGKTTTSKLIETILNNNNYKAYRNRSGANLDNGIVSSYLEDSNLFGLPKSFIYIFETDEGSFPRVVKSLRPDIIVLLNLFRDQLDRYGEIDLIARNWLTTLSHISDNTEILINADDPQLTHIGSMLKAGVDYFGMSSPSHYTGLLNQTMDSAYCPKCGQKLNYTGVYFSHLGDYKCQKCKFTHPQVSLEAKDVRSPLPGNYNIYNSLAATITAIKIGITRDKIKKSMSFFTPAFGRMEEIDYQGHKIKLLLSKNPTGFNESLRTVTASIRTGPMLLLLNDNIADGTDVSWIWDVNFEMLKNYKFPLFVSGKRMWDLAIRLKYALTSGEKVNSHRFETLSNLKQAVLTATDMTRPAQTLWILSTYTAMLEVRKILTGRKIL